MNLTNNKSGKYLYRYLPVNLNSLKILIDNEFYLSPPDILNDPFEGDFKIANLPELYNENTFKILLETRKKEGIEWLDKNTEDRLLEAWREDKQKFQLYLEEHLSNTIKRRFGTTSFSENCKSILMWSHYADTHKGFVIVFDKDKLYSDYGILNYISDVEYEGVPEISVDAKDLSIKNGKEALLKNKLRIWKKEKEVRIIKEHRSETGYEYDSSRLLKFPIKSIVGVIYGSRMSIENVMTIDNLLRKHTCLKDIKTKSYFAKKSANKDKIIFEEFEKI